MNDRENIGKIASELMQKIPESRDPIELERAMHKDYEKNIDECVERGLKEYRGDFYVVVLTKREKLLQNVLRNMFFHRETCPTPDYDQTVYRYFREGSVLEFYWVLPAKDVCEMFRENVLFIPPEEKDLLGFILDFYDGSLLKKSKMLNNEQRDSNILTSKG